MEIRKSLNDYISDISLLKTSKRSAENSPEQAASLNFRIQSVALKSFVILYASLSVLCVFTALVVLPAAPLFSIACLIVGIASFVLAHDTWVMGETCHQLANLIEPPKASSFFEGFAEALGKVKYGVTVAVKTFDERDGIKDPRLSGTWLVGPVYRLIS